MEPNEPKSINAEALRMLKHDIKNQLSNIIMSIEQLRYEVTEASPDCTFYMDTVSDSCSKINHLLDASE